MIEELQFLENNKPVVTAAAVGISRRRWISTTVEEIKSGAALGKMAENRFDVLPIEADGVVRTYYKTKEKGVYTDAVVCSIRGEDLMHQETNIRTVIRRMANEQRDFYFLIHQYRISGFVSSFNLNSRQVQAYIFHLIVELETALAEFLNLKVQQETIVDWVKGRAKYNDGVPNKCANILKEYEDNLEGGFEKNISEHFYLVDLLSAIKKLDINSAENETLNMASLNLKKYKSFSEDLNELRNLAGHPVRSLIDQKNTLEKLNSRLDLLDETLFDLLNNHLYHKIR